VAGWLFAAVWPVLLLLRWTVALAAAVPGAVVHLPAPGGLAIACYAGALGLGLAAWHLRLTHRRTARRLALVAGALALSSALLTLWPALRPADGRLRVSVLDVGQGEAIVIEGPDGRTVLVDAGAGGPYRLDAGERVVAPFLWNRGVLRLTAVVVTHPDVDHAGGMTAVRTLFSVREAWDGAPEGGPLALGGAVLTPLPAAAAGRNDAARVLRLEMGYVSVLLTSDIEGPGERALVASGAPLGATVLKVPHHGSRTSSSPELLAAIRPAIAVVSAGVRNAYGHPDAGVLTRLTAAGADVYRTDRDGAILLETDGRTLDVTRWVSRTTTRYCLDPDTTCPPPDDLLESPAYGEDQRELPQAQGQLPVQRHRQADPRVHRGASRRAHHPPGHRRRHPAAAARRHQGHARGGGRDVEGRDLPRLRARLRLRVPDPAHRQARLRRARRQRLAGRDRGERRQQE
jgi:beta-lactamase superfamily II metal-dependent hydrolase